MTAVIGCQFSGSDGEYERSTVSSWSGVPSGVVKLQKYDAENDRGRSVLAFSVFSNCFTNNATTIDRNNQ